MADENTLPDALEPRAHDSHHGRPESYWVARNALVDAAVALSPSANGLNVWASSADRTADEQAQWDAYSAALDDLKAFDAANGGTPVL